MNPLGFARTDFVDYAVAGPGPYVVTDVSTGQQVPSQVMLRNSAYTLRWLGADVPSLGYRVYRVAAGTPASQPPPRRSRPPRVRSKGAAGAPYSARAARSRAWSTRRNSPSESW